MTAVAMHPEATTSAAAKSGAAVRIAVIIVHYKTPQMLLECIATLMPELSAADRVVVVDNASGAEQLAALKPLAGNAGVTLLESEKNLGFAGANNLAITQVMQGGGAEYFLLLNPDTLIRPGAIATLLRFLESHPEAACVGPRLEDPDATPQQSAFRNPSPVSEFLRGASIGPIEKMFKRFRVHGPIIETPQPTDWLAGACVLLRAQMIQKAGLLDDRFFMYFEEVDYFRHAKKLGFQAWYEPAAHVIHLVGQSSGINVAPGQKRLPAYWFESRHRYFRKHYGYFGTLLADLFWLKGHILDRARKLVTGTSHAAVAKGEAADLLRHFFKQLFHPFKTSPRAGGGAV